MLGMLEVVMLPKLNLSLISHHWGWPSTCSQKMVSWPTKVTRLLLSRYLSLYAETELLSGGGKTPKIDKFHPVSLINSLVALQTGNFYRISKWDAEHLSCWSELLTRRKRSVLNL
jgi:hypothetical protein